MKKMVGLSLHNLQSEYGDMRALEIAKEIGADAVDFSISNAPHWDFREESSVYSRGDSEITEYFTALRKRADELGLVISQTHGRLRGYTLDGDNNRTVLENARLDCLATQVLRAPVCVMHSVATGLVGPETPAQTMRNLNAAWFCDALAYAKKYGVKIATETFGDSPKYGICDFFGQADEFLASYDRIASKGDNAAYFTACVDTGHSNKAMRFGNPKPADVIRQLGSRISTLHLNDNDTMTDQHKTPMTGCIDWEDVFNALDEIGYSGVYNMELNLVHFGKSFMVEEARFAVKVMRHLLCERYGEEGVR